MKKVYIVLTYTGTTLSKIVRLYTRKEFSHVSLSLDKKLKKMYSFGRLNPYIPFIGGFVHESINDGTFKRFHKTVCEVYSYDVSDEQYEIISDIIRDMYREKEKYKFNVIGLFIVPLKVSYKRNKYFYCAEFVKYLFDSAGIDLNLKEPTKPYDFHDLEGSKVLYKGLLKKYKL